MATSLLIPPSYNGGLPNNNAPLDPTQQAPGTAPPARSAKRYIDANSLVGAKAADLESKGIKHDSRGWYQEATAGAYVNPIVGNYLRGSKEKYTSGGGGDAPTSPRPATPTFDGGSGSGGQTAGLSRGAQTRPPSMAGLMDGGGGGMDFGGGGGGSLIGSFGGMPPGDGASIGMDTPNVNSSSMASLMQPDPDTPIGFTGSDISALRQGIGTREPPSLTALFAGRRPY